MIHGIFSFNTSSENELNFAICQAEKLELR